MYVITYAWSCMYVRECMSVCTTHIVRMCGMCVCLVMYDVHCKCVYMNVSECGCAYMCGMSIYVVMYVCIGACLYIYMYELLIELIFFNLILQINYITINESLFPGT